MKILNKAYISISNMAQKHTEYVCFFIQIRQGNIHLPVEKKNQSN